MWIFLITGRFLDLCSKTVKHSAIGTYGLGNAMSYVVAPATAVTP